MLSLAGAALLMGLAAGPHCIAMCGPACGGVIRIVRSGERAEPGLALTFHAGRLLGYALAGAAAAQAVQSLAWLTTHTAALRPVWTLFQVAVLVWGLTLLASGRQPAIVSSAGRQVWNRLRPMASPPAAVFTTGVLWALMPCGLLYSALLVASLTGGPLAGAFAMSLLALGSAVSLLAAPPLLRRVRLTGDRWARDGGTRLSGLLIVASAVWALWMDVFHRVAIWCGLA
jgi:uncharacterized protein